MPNYTDTPKPELEDLFTGLLCEVEKFRTDLMERKNRGALLIEIVEPIDHGKEKKVSVGDIIEVTSPEGKLKKAEVIQTCRIMAYHAEYGPVPCHDMLVEVLDPDRMTKDDFEDLYGENESNIQEEVQVLGSICECGADRSDCNLNQEHFGIHANPYEE